MAEYGGHGGFKGRAKFKLVETEKAPAWVENAVVGVHGGHEAASKCMAGEKGDGGHGVTSFCQGVRYNPVN